MKSDKIFYASWGLALILIGVCIIIGLGLHLDFWTTFMLWLLSVGILLVIVGIITASTDRKTAILQVITGELLAAISLGILAIYLHILDVYVTLGLIIIIIGGSVIFIGLSRKR
jgi:hypothetical protein